MPHRPRKPFRIPDAVPRLGHRDRGNHHVIDLSEKFIDMLRDIEGVVDRTCGVEQDHTDDEPGS